MPYNTPLYQKLEEQEAMGYPVSTIQRVRAFLNNMAIEAGEPFGQDFSGFLNPKIQAPGSR